MEPLGVASAEYRRGIPVHLETTPASARALVDHCRDELVPAPHVQSEAGILDVAPERYRVINGLMADVLAFLTAPRS